MRRQLLITALLTLVLSLSVAWADGTGKGTSPNGDPAVKTPPATVSAPDADRGVGNGESTEVRSGSAQPILVASDSSATRKNANAAKILFDYEKTSLKDGGRAEAEKCIAKLKQNTKDTVIVEGHTCLEADADYIMTLGQRRAEAVKKYMVERGIEPARIKVESCGEAKPLVSNDTPPNRKLNRRVEVQYIPCK
jgi:OOP family OmpA-OmpF porin